VRNMAASMKCWCTMDAGRWRRRGIPHARSVVDQYFAGIRREDAVEHLHGRGLANAVLTDNAVLV
jgi:hypothetical protein